MLMLQLLLRLLLLLLLRLKLQTLVKEGHQELLLVLYSLQFLRVNSHSMQWIRLLLDVLLRLVFLLRLQLLLHGRRAAAEYGHCLPRYGLLLQLLLGLQGEQLLSN